MNKLKVLAVPNSAYRVTWYDEVWLLILLLNAVRLHNINYEAIVSSGTNLQRWNPHTVGQIWPVGLQQSDEGKQLVFAAVLPVGACRQETQMRYDVEKNGCVVLYMLNKQLEVFTHLSGIFLGHM